MQNIANFWILKVKEKMKSLPKNLPYLAFLSPQEKIQKAQKEIYPSRYIPVLKVYF